jgi:hypothetical protein
MARHAADASMRVAAFAQATGAWAAHPCEFCPLAEPPKRSRHAICPKASRSKSN